MKKRHSKPHFRATERRSHLSNEELERNYQETLNSILENNDENAKDNMSDYMDELREESEALE